MATSPTPPAPPRELLEPKAETSAVERLIAAEVRKARGPLSPTAPPLTSPLLARAAAFLPNLAAANDALAAAVAAGEPPSTFDVEAVDEGAPHVAMEVACGVVELGDDAALAAAEVALAAGGPGGLPLAASTPSSSSESESESEGEEEEEGYGGGKGEEEAAGAEAAATTAAATTAPLRRRKRRAGIEEVG